MVMSSSCHRLGLVAVCCLENVLVVASVVAAAVAVQAGNDVVAVAAEAVAFAAAAWVWVLVAIG